MGAPHAMTINKHHIVIQASFMEPQVSGPPAGYQTLANGETTPEISQVAKELLGGAMGTQTPFSIDGKQYMARVEQHYHPYPPANATLEEQSHYQKPWGPHKGVTVYKAKGATSPTENYQPDRPASGRLQLLQRLDALLKEFES
jgi:hypothetical protein